MKYYFCLMNKDDLPKGKIPGKRFVYDNKDKWIEKSSDNYCKYLTAGYVKGVDFVVHNGKTYSMLKSYMDLDLDCVIILCVESVVSSDVDYRTVMK